MVHTLDLQFLGHSESIAAYLIESPRGPIVVEAGPYSTFGALKHALAHYGYAVSDVKHVLLTHIHLDHAGAAWAFAAEGATIHVHPAGAKHLMAPEKLMASAKMIYKDEMDRLWGDMHPILPEHIHEVQHEEDYGWMGIPLKAHYTPGHAIHHVAWQLGDALFTGDVAGVRIKNQAVVPPCPPPDIQLEDWAASIALMRRLNPAKLYLTHYGEVLDVDAHFTALERGLKEWSEWMFPHWQAQTPADQITPQFQAYVAQSLIGAGVAAEDLPRYEAANPAWMSVAGLLRYFTKYKK